MSRSLPGLSLAALWLVASAAAVAAAQTPAEADRPRPQYPLNVEQAPRPTMRATRISTPIEIDGRLDEEAWSRAEPIDQFTQAKPQAGYPASERTEVRIVYDDKKIYVGAICYDAEPQKAVTTTLEQDFDSPNRQLRRDLRHVP